MILVTQMSRPVLRVVAQQPKWQYVATNPDHQDEPVYCKAEYSLRKIFCNFPRESFCETISFAYDFLSKMACLLQQGMFSSTVFSANEPLHLVGPACSKEDFPSTETLLPPACHVNIFTPDPPKKLRAGPREDWLRAPRRRLTDWSVAECQSQRTRPTSTPKTWHSRPWEKTHQSEEGVRLLDPASPGWHQ